MTAYEDVLVWASSRPWWQQKALARIATGEALGQQDHEEIARSLFEEPESAPSGGWFTELVPTQATKDEPVRVVAVRGLSNVNRLASGQELTFEPDGITVVFGNNGSGKSGYARVIRSMVRTRHRADILPDVFAQSPSQQSGEVVFTVGANERDVQLGQSVDPDLSRVAFFDEQCGDTYLTAEAEISYRPAAVQLLDDLAAVCAGVRQVIDGWKQAISQSVPLPDVDDLGPGGIFLQSLSASTTDDAISAAVACPSDVDERLANQVNEIARLRASDPAKEKRQLSATAVALETISQHIADLDKALGVDGQGRLHELSERVTTTQRAADLASRNTFADEPLSGVGSSVWQVLWRAAEGYSKEVYPEHIYPHTEEGSVCVLCQQRLTDEASDRLNRFHRFVTDTTTREAETAQRELERIRDGIAQLELVPRAVSSAMATVRQRDETLANSLDSLLEKLHIRKQAMVNGEQSIPVDTSMHLSRLKADAIHHRIQAEDVNAEGFAEQLAEAQSEEKRLRDQIAMHDGRGLIEAERSRLQKVAALNSKFSEANTRSITDKAGELTRRYVTEEARDRFAHEAERLGLERVTFKATKARQGALLHKVDFLKARPGAKLVEVLSEGEQTALGFAGFLTEAHFDTSRSALVFDDPVSSLDHMKRESVARRIIALAEERQVVVFTHDIAFTMLLRKAAGESNVSVATRGIEQRRKVGPGFTTMDHPWTALDAAQRIETLRREVADLRRNEIGIGEGDYLREVENIAGHMSQTWERVISQVLAEPLVDYRALEVRVGKLRVVGRVTAEDVKTYDDSYSRISGWASRHDPHPELNYNPPSVDQLNNEIEVLATWLKKVKKYQSS
ncbi:AAA family ATPase [Corynebacterium variabile]|uniref:AAA family ATPase n=1 Tax=Corynebacterium variabile TaxID=1727 RepID=UPI0028A6476F|nr:AAA family ATPase [Corynebacterium variabile]